MDSSKTRDPQTQICVDILRIWQRLKSYIEQYASEHDLTLQQIFVLYRLYHQDGILMGALAHQLHCDASNVTGLVDRLLSAGLISRTEMPEDRRAKQIAITAQGRGLIEDLLPRLPAEIGVDRLPAGDLEQLGSLLKRLAAPEAA